MAAAVMIKNNGGKDVTLTSAILSHLKLKKRAKAGFKDSGCLPTAHRLLYLRLSKFCLHQKLQNPSLQDYLNLILSLKGSWKEQDVPFTILNNRLSRAYAAPPQERLKAFYNTSPTKYEVLDQGKELFFRLVRMGFEDIYIGSPGSSAEKYGKDYFVCTGPAAMLVPVVVKPGEDWKGAQMIEHDNL